MTKRLWIQKTWKGSWWQAIPVLFFWMMWLIVSFYTDKGLPDYWLGFISVQVYTFSIVLLYWVNKNAESTRTPKGKNKQRKVRKGRTGNML